MLSGDFQRKIKKLNPHLRIFCGNDDSRPATLYFSKFNVGLNGEEETDYVEVCAVDKNYLPEFPIVDDTNHIVKGGWRRAVNILIHKGLVDKRKADKVFGTRFDNPIRLKTRDASDEIERSIKEITNRNSYYRGSEKIFDRDELTDLGRMIGSRRNKQCPQPLVK